MYKETYLVNLCRVSFEHFVLDLTGGDIDDFEGFVRRAAVQKIALGVELQRSVEESSCAGDGI